jgi:hypothetical protein
MHRVLGIALHDAHQLHTQHTRSINQSSGVHLAFVKQYKHDDGLRHARVYEAQLLV